VVFQQKNLETIVEDEFLDLGGFERGGNSAKHKHYASDETKPKWRHDTSS
jgi:hypothetical protein